MSLNLRECKVKNGEFIQYRLEYNKQMPDLDDKIRYVVAIMLDKVAIELGPWSRYNVLAPHHF